MSYVYELKREHIPLLREAHGQLYSSAKCFFNNYKVKNNQKIVTIGDKVTFTLIKEGIFPDLAIIDFFIQNKPIDDLKSHLLSYEAENIHCVNERGTVGTKLWNLVKSFFQNNREKRLRIIVDGEEDLAGIPVTVFAPEGTLVIYGMPNKGLVACEVDVSQKEKVKLILGDELQKKL